MRVFHQVADAGSFTAAARALDLSTAVVTRLVADLEEHLGTRLLQRTTRRVSLTEAGQTYLVRVRHILQDIDEAHAAVSAQTQDMAGVLRIQAPPVMAVHILSPLVAGFRALYPRVVLDIDVDSPEDPRIEEHDITLLGADASFDAHVIARPVIHSQAVLVAAPAYVRRRGAVAEPADLSRHDVLRLRHPGPRPQHWRLMHASDSARVAEVPVQPVLWANHTDTLLRAAVDGAGISSMPLELVAPLLASGQLVRVLPGWITGQFTLFAALPSRRFVPQRTRVFLDYLTERTRAMVAQVTQGVA
jgi:DNA-binding transcriptional LysR family regulator